MAKDRIGSTIKGGVCSTFYNANCHTFNRPFCVDVRLAVMLVVPAFMKSYFLASQLFKLSTTLIPLLTFNTIYTQMVTESINTRILALDVEIVFDDPAVTVSPSTIFSKPNTPPRTA